MQLLSILFRLALAIALVHFLNLKASAAEETAAPPAEDVNAVLAHEADLVRLAQQHPASVVKTVSTPKAYSADAAPRDYTADNLRDLMVREADLIQQAQGRVTGRKTPISDPISDLIIHEAALIAAAGTTPQLIATKPIDRVSVAERMVANEDYRMAASILKDIAKSTGATEDERARAELILAQISLHQGKQSDAVIQLSAWLGEFPRRRESPFVHFLLGQCYRDLGAYEQARDNFYRVMSGSLVAASASDNGSFSQEKKLVRAAIWELAETEYEQRNWERALTFFERFNTQHPAGDQLMEASLFRKADCQYQMHQMDEATQGYEKALAIAPFHPFAPEAWLRLYFLYGMQQRPQKQNEAMQALSWIVSTLQPNRVAYWQQRGISMMLELPQEGRPQLVQLRNTLRDRADDPGWKPIVDYLDDLCSRITLDKSAPQLTQIDAPRSGDSWAQWKTDYTQKRDQLQQEAKPLLERGPMEDSAAKKNL